VSGDQLYYYMVRRWGPKIIAKRLSWRESAEVVYTHLRRHQYWLILTFRFYYGIRNVTPFAIGSAHIPRLRFFILNLIGGVIWAFAFAYGGYFLGETFERFIGDYHRYVIYVFGFFVLLGFCVWALSTARTQARTHVASRSKATA
jgi:membrane protein DedA with SNARE-associated domain